MKRFITMMASLAMLVVPVAASAETTIKVCDPSAFSKPLLSPLSGGTCKESYALVTLGEGKEGKAGPEGPEGKEGKEGPEGKEGKEGAPGAGLFAAGYVNASGEVEGHSLGSFSVVNLGGGHYIITWGTERPYSLYPVIAMVAYQTEPQKNAFMEIESMNKKDVKLYAVQTNNENPEVGFTFEAF
jgi:hypothetical protein